MSYPRIVRQVLVAGLVLSLGACSSESTDVDEASTSEDSGGRGRPSVDNDADGDRDDVTQADTDSDPTDAESAPDTATDVAQDSAQDSGPADTAPADTTSPDTGQPDSSVSDVTIDDGCSAKLRFIYVIGKDKNLYQFDPDAAEFSLVGGVECDEFLDTTPSSMAMSTLGVALINYSDSSLQTVSIDDASCVESGWTPGTGGFSRFGMGYVADSIGGPETLYISNATTLGRVDTTTWTVTPVGPLPSQSELTGTGNGELWGFFPLESPPQLRQLDRNNASTLATFNLPPLPPSLDTFAFTAWGGEFYIFYRLSGLGESTTVYRFNRRSGAHELVREDSGINAVGAGVSICAPTSR